DGTPAAVTGRIGLLAYPAAIVRGPRRCPYVARLSRLSTIEGLTVVTRRRVTSMRIPGRGFRIKDAVLLQAVPFGGPAGIRRVGAEAGHLDLREVELDRLGRPAVLAVDAVGGNLGDQRIVERVFEVGPARHIGADEANDALFRGVRAEHVVEQLDRGLVD